MAYKHQTDSFRTVNGIRWMNVCDLVGPDFENAARAVNAAGVPCKRVAHAPGEYRLFVAPDRFDEACDIFNEVINALD